MNKLFGSHPGFLIGYGLEGPLIGTAVGLLDAALGWLADRDMGD